ncbi:hypothetical protein NDU88_007851 [Pleurodeles waltl]|uniref:Uncharacterized protein n=1 Tax=Pleurodeles waltl TaxID=8319 RepID=A0AAV7N6J8_PLEWA|nr:hypothetical protein NDU88_007851 [Pleurodeles waltl]
MPGGWSSHKNTGKPARHLLFSEALLQTKGAPPQMATQPSTTHQEMANPAQEPTMDLFSKETSDRHRAFLALRPRLRQLEVKYGLFDPARMWITKNCTSKDFYDPEDLRSFLDGLSLTVSSTLTPHRDMMATDQNTPSQDLAPGRSGSGHQSALPCPRGRDLERLLHSHDNRGQVLHAVALHTQVADRDKSRSPLKPLVETT